MKEEIVKEIMKQYNVSEDFVKLLIKICLDNNVCNIEAEINRFLRDD